MSNRTARKADSVSGDRAEQLAREQAIAGLVARAEQMAAQVRAERLERNREGL